MKVPSRTPFDGSRQREALTALQRESGKAATAVAAEIGLSYNQYLRYVWGQTPLRIDQLETFAAAYGVPVRRLVDTIFCGPERVLGASAAPPTPDDPPWDQLRSVVPRDELERLVARYGHADLLTQQHVVDEARRATDAAIARSRPQRSRPA